MALMLIGCGQQKIDGSSEEAFTKSLQEMKKGLTIEEKEQLEASIKVITLKGSNIAELKDRKYMMRKTMDKVGGMTADEIMTKGKSIAEHSQNNKMDIEIEKTIESCHELADNIIDDEEKIVAMVRENKGNESTDIEFFHDKNEIIRAQRINTANKEKTYEKYCLKYEN